MLLSVQLWRNTSLPCFLFMFTALERPTTLGTVVDREVLYIAPQLGQIFKMHNVLAW